MAKLSAHGQILATFHYLKYDKRFMSDGYTLINCGDGWKLKSRVKAGYDVPTVFKQTSEAHFAKLDACPNYKDFLKLLLAETNLKNRAVVVAAFQLLGNDLDGLWSSLDDYGIFIDLETLKEMSDCYERGMKELSEYKKTLVARTKFGSHYLKQTRKQY